MSKLRVYYKGERSDDYEYVHAPQDIGRGIYKDGIFFYGAKFNKELYFILSNREFITKKYLNGCLLLLKNEEMDASGITRSLIEKFTQKNHRVNPHAVFSKIREYIRRYVIFQDENIYDLISVWIMGTYIFRAFRHFPYIHLQAEKNSGKTHFLEVIKDICFNGKLFINPTGSVLFHEAHVNLPTMLIDETEDFSKKSRSSHRDIMDILNSGYSKTGTVSRVVKGGKVQSYSTYGPKVFSGINNINDVLESRSIYISILRKLEEEKIERYTDSQTTLRVQEGIREQLYMFGLQYAMNIYQIYNEELDKIPYLESASNRRFDIWAPLFAIANIIDTQGGSGNFEVSERLNRYMIKEQLHHETADSLENTTVSMLGTLKDILPRLNYLKKSDYEGGTELRYLRDDVLKQFQAYPEWKKVFDTKNKLTMAMNRLGIKCAPETIDGKSERCYKIRTSELIEFAQRYGFEFSFDGILRPQSRRSSEFIPKRIIITKDSENAPFTHQMLQRIKALNPRVEVIKSPNENPLFPAGLNPVEQQRYIAETLVLATRKSPFIFTFPSPGNIVEDMTTIMQLSYHCSSSCTYCYLHTAGRESIKWRKIYTNIDDIESEVQKEHLVHRAALTLWSAISFYLGRPLPKIPIGFNEVIDDMRAYFNSNNSKIETDSDVKRYLKDTLADKLAKLGLEIDYKKIEPIKSEIHRYYNENMKHKLIFNVSEFSDIVRTDHITNHLEYLMLQVQKDKDFMFKFYTQSANIGSMLKYPGKNQVEVTMVFNTDHVISSYCEGTASLDERIQAAKNIIASDGINLKISIEPIITYNGYERDYAELADRLIKELDLNSDKVKVIKFGAIRISPQLLSTIRTNFPDTALVTGSTQLQQPVAPDPKHRYSYEVRRGIYELLLNKFAPVRRKVFIACELPEMWSDLGINFTEHLSGKVYQFPGV